MRSEQRSGLSMAVLASLGAFGLGALATLSGALRPFETRLLDMAYQGAGPPSRPPEDLALVLVDSKSLLAMRSFWAGEEQQAREEAWPWHRFFFGVLADFLARAGAAAVAVDLDLSGPSAHEVDGDSELAGRFFGASGRTVLSLNFKEVGALEAAAASPFLRRLFEEADRTAKAAGLPDPPPGLDLPDAGYDSVQVPYGPLSAPGTARALGFVNAGRDGSEALRRLPLLLRYKGSVVPSLSLAVARTLGEGAPGRLPVDQEGRILINWYGGLEAFQTHTAHTVLKTAFADLERRLPADDPLALGWAARIGPEEVEALAARFRGKVVFIGVNAPELGDVFPTPFTPAFPGVAVHATALGNLLRREALNQAAPALRLGLLLLLALAGGLGTRAAGGERRGLAVYLLLLLLAGAGFLLAWRGALLWFDLAAPTAVLTLAYGATALGDYFQTGRARRKLRRTFDRVLQPSLIDLLLAEPSRLSLGGEVRPLTVLFTDLQNSTALSERFRPEEWVDRLNRYFSECTRIVLSRGGYLDKYIGDGIMAAWGAPVPLADHAYQACLAVLELDACLEALQREMVAAEGVTLTTRMGLNTGAILVGMVGGEGLAHYTAMGDGVVIASRLEGANKYYGTRILMGEQTYAAVAGRIEAREVDLVVLKGKSRPLRIYEPVAPKGALPGQTSALLELYGRALEAYRRRSWAEALEALEALGGLAPADGPSRVLRDRILQFRGQEPPPGWAGEFLLPGK